MRPKKHLGQHFLTSQSALDDMVRAADIKNTDTVVEVGPGKGILTSALLRTGAHIIAIEKDTDLIPLLKTSYAQEILHGQLDVIKGDITTIDRASILPQTPYKVVANIPYYITGEIIRLFLEHTHPPTSLTLLVQKEVALRIVARDNKESILSLSVKIFGTPSYISTVKRGSFFPIPGVDSAVIHIGNISHDKLSSTDTEIFFKLVKTGFAHKRKKLLSNLSLVYKKDMLMHAFEVSRINETSRAEDVHLSEWIKLISILK